MSVARASYWVFLRDRGSSPEALAREIRVRGAALAKSTLRRRQRVRGQRRVDRRDLLPNARYVAAIVQTGAKLRIQSRWLNAVSVVATDTQRARIEALPFVESTQPVAASSGTTTRGKGVGRASDEGTNTSESSPLGYGIADDQVALVGVPELHRCGLDGAGVVIGVLDTGFSLEHRAFAHLGQRVLAQYDFVNDDAQVHDEPGDPAGQQRHGTSVLSLLAGLDEGQFVGVAPQASYLLAKIDDLRQDSAVEDDWWVAGLEWVESEGADIAVTAIAFCAGGGACTPDRMDGKTEPTSRAAALAVQNGMLVVSAAGNAGAGPTTIRAPGDAPQVLAIGSVNLEGVLARSSSRGPTFDGRIKPDLVAPGDGVAVVDDSTRDRYRWPRGTSFAAPIAAGVAALVLQAFPDTPPETLRELLTSSARRDGPPDHDSGWGMIDAFNAIGGECPTAVSSNADAEPATVPRATPANPQRETGSAADHPAESVREEVVLHGGACGAAGTPARSRWLTVALLVLLVLRTRVGRRPLG
jgi:serine protease AprX